jgi:predicted metal-dependent hydrolase
MINYVVKRSNRKTAAIVVSEDRVEVRVPLMATSSEIKKIVSAHEKWIKNRLEKIRERADIRGSFSLDYGDTIRLRGERRRIVARDGKNAGFDGEEFYMPPGYQPPQIKKIVIKTYRILALRHFCKKADEFSKHMRVDPLAVKVTGAKTRWGSCSAKKSVNFSWRLIMASDYVIDYVIVHELAHLKEMNHSDRFWALVANVLPDYKKRKAGLRVLQKELANEDWET